MKEEDILVHAVGSFVACRSTVRTIWLRYRFCEGMACLTKFVGAVKLTGIPLLYNDNGMNGSGRRNKMWRQWARHITGVDLPLVLQTDGRWTAFIC